MTSAAYNALARQAARNTPLPGIIQRGGGIPRYKWRVTAQPYSGRQWCIDVGTGCVSEVPAVIEYRRTGDPRGWTMPEDYPPFAQALGIFGAAYPFVDRPMWDDPRPFLLLTAPASGDPTDLGGFIATPPAQRPRALRTAAHWRRDCYHASVWVSVTTWRADPSIDLVRGRDTQHRLARWRVFAGRLPIGTDGVRPGDAKELARIFLLRDPQHPAADNIHVQQRVFWDLQSRTVEPTLGLGTQLSFLDAGQLTDLLASLDLGQINDILESAGATEFWTV